MPRVQSQSWPKQQNQRKKKQQLNWINTCISMIRGSRLTLEEAKEVVRGKDSILENGKFEIKTMHSSNKEFGNMKLKQVFWDTYRTKRLSIFLKKEKKYPNCPRT